MKITGDAPKVKRLIMDMQSFDQAFINKDGEIGIPIGWMTEVSGATSVGKSTTVYGLSGMIAKHVGCNISLVDLEGFDPDFVTTVFEHTGFDGELRVIQRGDDEDCLDDMASLLRGDKNFGVGIVDSVGAISPISEAEGDLGEANMGRRGKLLAQLSRKMMKIRRDNPDIPKTIFLLNHINPILGGRGFYTPGGDTKNFLAHIRLRLKRKEVFPDQSYVIEGKVIKNRFGYDQRIFHIVVLAGTGIHIGLTWMFDGFLNGTVKRDKWIKIGDKTICRLKEAFEQAHAGNDEFFLPFREAVYNVDPDDLYVISGQAEVDAKENEDGIEVVESPDEEPED